MWRGNGLQQFLQMSSYQFTIVLVFARHYANQLLIKEILIKTEIEGFR